MLNAGQFKEQMGHRARTQAAFGSGRFNGRAPTDRGFGTGRAASDYGVGTGINIDSNLTSMWAEFGESEDYWRRVV
jgi:hypothetical protein